MEQQNIIDKYLNKISHAYLLKTNDISKVIDFAKKIISMNTSNEENIDKLIETGAYSDLRIIKPNGQWIKKEQIIELQTDFKVKSVYNNKRIYIIQNAENLNKSSGNTLLKFLEEPDDDIVALLMTDNKNKVLDTIVSRCQYVQLDSNNDTLYQNYDDALKICLLLNEKKHLAGIELVQLLDGYEDRLSIKELFQKMLLIYDQCLLKYYNIELNIKDNEDLFDKVYKTNTIDSIKKNMNALIFIIDALDYNLNLKLLVDKLLILMFGVD